MHQISQREPVKEPVRQSGWMKDAEGVKYRSRVARCTEGGVCVRLWITWGISETVEGG